MLMMYYQKMATMYTLTFYKVPMETAVVILPRLLLREYIYAILTPTGVGVSKQMFLKTQMVYVIILFRLIVMDRVVNMIYIIHL